jgi:hypothetical protein
LSNKILLFKFFHVIKGIHEAKDSKEEKVLKVLNSGKEGLFPEIQ